MYIDDLFHLNNEKLNEVLGNALLSYAIIPGLVGSFTSNKKGLLSLNLSLFLINFIFQYITFKPVVESLFVLLMSGELETNLIDLSKATAHNPASYNKKWNLRSAWDDHK